MSDKNIRVGFSIRNGNALSWLIRKLTKSPVSHTWLLYYSEDFQCDMVLEATVEGFRTLPLEAFKAQGSTVIQIFAPKYSLDAGFAAMKDDIGERYDVDGLLGAFIPIMGAWFKRKWHNPFHSSKELFCSEAVTKCMQYSDYPDSSALIADDVNPKQLYDFFANE